MRIRAPAPVSGSRRQRSRTRVHAPPAARSGTLASRSRSSKSITTTRRAYGRSSGSGMAGCNSGKTSAQAPPGKARWHLTRSTGGSAAAAGGRLRCGGPTVGSAAAAGGRLRCGGSTVGSAAAAGGRLRCGGPTVGSAAAAGGRLRCGGAVRAGRPWWRARQPAAGRAPPEVQAAPRQRFPAAAPACAVAPVAACAVPAVPRSKTRPGDAADADIDRDPALLGPVDVLQVEQQGELIDDERQAAAVADGDRRVTAVPLLAADGDLADGGQQADAPHVVMQVRAADADVAERPPARPDAVGEPA